MSVNESLLMIYPTSKILNIVFSELKEKDRLYLQILKWIGFKHTVIEIEHAERFEGASSYNYYKLIKLALVGIISHSTKLLKASIVIGFILSFFSFLFGIFIFIKYLYYELQPGWTSIILTIFFSTGLILVSIGVLGIYIGKIFEQIKDRPLYIVDKILNYEL